MQYKDTHMSSRTAQLSRSLIQLVLQTFPLPLLLTQLRLQSNHTPLLQLSLNNLNPLISALNNAF